MTVDLASMRYYESMANPKDWFPKVMVDLMHNAIDDMHASFETHFCK
jgi:hypothetical protein